MKALARAIAMICLFGFQLKATTYYVNDASLTGDIYTGAVGSNSNPGTAALPFATLTYALTLAAPNDIIYIDAGSYNDKNLTLNAANLSIIGAGPSATVFNNNYASANSNLFLTIQANGVVAKNLMVIKYNYGLGSNGKAITIKNALNVLLYNLVLTDNADNGDAALLILSNSTVTIKKGSYSCNLSGGAYGGGIDIGDANTTVSNVTVLIDSAAISYNSKTQVQGGGIDVYGTASVFVTVTNCIVSDNLSNTLSIGGAGIYQEGGTVTVRKTCFTNNNSDDASQTNYGGAYFVTSGTTRIANCSFTNNKSGRGGAIAAYSLNGPISLVVDSCSFSGNTYSSTTINPTAKDLFARVAFSSAVTVTGTENTFSTLANAVANYNTATVTLSNSGNPSKMGLVTLTNTTTATWTPNSVCPAIIGACVCTTPAITSAAPVASICSGSTFTTSLTANTAGVYTSYSWSSSAVAGITGHSTSGTGNISETLTNSIGGVLTVTYTITPNYNGLCSGSAVVYSVSVVPKPTLTITGSTAICAGQSTVLTGATASSYSWSTGVTTNTISVSPPLGTTNYTLTGDNGGGCVSTARVAGFRRAPVPAPGSARSRP